MPDRRFCAARGDSSQLCYFDTFLHLPIRPYCHWRSFSLSSLLMMGIQTSTDADLAGQKARFETFKNRLVIVDAFDATLLGFVQLHLS